MIINDLTTLAFLYSKNIVDSQRGRDINGIVISDLMSDVLTCEYDNMLLITGLCTDQALRTADIVGAAAIVVSSGKKITPAMISIAEEADIPLFTTHLRNFELAAALCAAYPELREGARIE